MYLNYKTKIFVAAPANAATGGPELLHQLVHELNNLGFNAYMYYYDFSKEYKTPIHDEYKKYKNNYVDFLDDSKDNILIVPETKTTLIYNFKNMKKIIWWLSIDNYYISKEKINNSNKKIKNIIKNIIKFKKLDKSYNFEKNNIIHFVQSSYAKDYLIKKNISNIYYLSDYLNTQFIKNQSIDNKSYSKENIVIYNPKKGIKFTNKLISFSKNIKFIPIQNMTSVEVAELLKRAKVYIDFGNHPGKDRIPREAAISGCCVITNKQGSASFHEDVPINNEYKFNGLDKDIPLIISKIIECFDNFDIKNKDFCEYRNMIKNEKNQFIKDIEIIFNENNQRIKR